MSGWLRLYDEVLDDPKVQNLSAEDFRAWVNLLCLANRNDGKLPPISDIAFALRISPDAALTVVERLSNGGGNAPLIDRLSGGVNGYHHAPHGWDKRQYKSDTSTDRVKRFRERFKTVTETAPEQSRTEQSIPLAKANGHSPPDPEKIMFDSGIVYLRAAGKSESQARALLGKWKKARGGAGGVIEDLAAAQRFGAIDPVSWIEARHRAKAVADEWQSPC